MGRLVSGVALAGILGSGIGLAERVADPFERHKSHYALEGPSRCSEVFYLKVV